MKILFSFSFIAYMFVLEFFVIQFLFYNLIWRKKSYLLPREDDRIDEKLDGDVRNGKYGTLLSFIIYNYNYLIFEIHQFDNLDSNINVSVGIDNNLFFKYSGTAHKIVGGTKWLVILNNNLTWGYMELFIIFLHSDLFLLQNQNLQNSITGGTKKLVNKMKGQSSACITRSREKY